MDYPHLEFLEHDYAGRILDRVTLFEQGVATWIGSAGEGACELLLPDVYDERRFKVGRWLSAWARWPGEPAQHINHYLIRRRQRGRDKQRRRFLRLRALAPTHILGWRVIQSPNPYENRYAADGYLKLVPRTESTGYFVKQDYADDMMKDYAGQQLTRSAVPARSLATLYRFSVAPKWGLAPKQSKSAARTNLLATLKGIAKAAMDDRYRPVWLDFEVVVTGYDDVFALQFQTFVGQRGRNLGLESGRPLVIVPEMTEDVSWTDDWEKAVTVVTVSGIARASTTTIANKQTAIEEGIWEFQHMARRGEFPANVVEAWYTMPQEGVRESLAQEANRVLEDQGPERRLLLTLPTDGPLRLLRDVQFGDIVATRMGLQMQNARLAAAEFNQGANDGLAIKTRLDPLDRKLPTLRLPGGM